MNSLKKITAILSKVADLLDKIANFICVALLTLQVGTIGVLVVGRYFFRMIPQGTEELALLCMVWIAMLSISLCIRDDSHMKMDIIDMFVKPEIIEYFRVFCGILLVVFSGFMIRYGVILWKLKWGTTMSGLPLSGASYYAALPIAGILILISSLCFLLNTIVKIAENKLQKEDTRNA